MISYSRTAADAVLARVFGSAPGCYVDVGAGDPDRDSLTRHFHEFGWRGVNIEARAAAWARLAERRPGDTNLQVAIGAADGVAPLFVVTDDETLSTIDGAQAERLRTTGHHVEVQQVQTLTLDTVLADLAPASIDLLRIAVEGAEAAVFAGLDLERWRPRVIVVRAPRLWINAPLDDAWRHQLIARRYRERLCDGSNTFYVAEEAHVEVGPLQPATALDDFTPVAEHHLRVEVARHEAAQREVTAHVRRLEALLAECGVAPFAPAEAAVPLAAPAAAERPVVRLLVISNDGRDGRGLAARLSDMSGVAVRCVAHPGDIAWHELPAQFVLQLDWPASALIVRLVARHGIRVVVAVGSGDESPYASDWCSRPSALPIDPSQLGDDDSVRSLLAAITGPPSSAPTAKPATLAASVSTRPAPRPLVAPLRIAIIGTPRVGNTWIRRVLADTFGLQEVAVDQPEEIDWVALPKRCVLQLHWRRSEGLDAELAAHGFIVVAPARHPLDVLLSILVFVNRDGATQGWLNGAHGDERALVGAQAGDAAFVRYAESDRAGALLGVTPDWWASRYAIRVSYEDLLRDRTTGFRRLATTVGKPDPRRLAVAIDVNTPARLSRLSRGVHVWTARAGMHRELLAAPVVARLTEAHRDVFAQLGYAEP